MSRIRRGLPTHLRKNAKNFTHHQAQKRLDETVAPFNAQVWNSLQVNAVDADLFSLMAKTGKPCSCEKIEVTPELKNVPDSNVNGAIPTQEGTSSQGVNIKLKDNDFFGEYEGSILDDTDEDYDESYDDGTTEINISERQRGNTEYENGVFAGKNVDCGVCYRAGKQPGYSAYGKQRNVFTHYHVENMQNYWINTTEAPHTLERQSDSVASFVMYAVTVPKFFIGATYSVRDNTDILKDLLYTTEGLPLTLAELKKHSGHTLYFVCKSECFTHVVFEFQINDEKVKVNLSEEMLTMDFAMFDTISNMTVILPPYIHEIKAGDIVAVRKRRLVLKVSDVTRKMTAKQRRTEWSVQTRVVQPNEALRYINIAHKIGQFR